jgi:hypothetical protein
MRGINYKLPNHDVVVCYVECVNLNKPPSSTDTKDTNRCYDIAGSLPYLRSTLSSTSFPTQEYSPSAKARLSFSALKSLLKSWGPAGAAPGLANGDAVISRDESAAYKEDVIRRVRVNFKLEKPNPQFSPPRMRRYNPFSPKKLRKYHDREDTHRTSMSGVSMPRCSMDLNPRVKGNGNLTVQC